MTEEALVQIPGMLASTGQPGGDGDLSKAEDTLSSRRIQSFGQRRQHHCDLVRGGFQTKEGRVEPGSELSVAGLTAKGLDPLGTSMLAIPDQSTNVCVCDFKVGTLSVRTGEALGVHPLRCSPAAFHLSPGMHRQRRRLFTRRGRGSETTGGAIVWGARLQETLERSALGLPS